MKNSTIFHIAIALGFILGTAALTAAHATTDAAFISLTWIFGETK